MLNREEIKGIRGRLPKAFYYDESPETYQLIEQDIPALLSHVEALEERLRKAGEALKTECPACSEAQRRIAASGAWAYTEACSKCQACSKALAELSPSES